MRKVVYGLAVAAFVGVFALFIMSDSIFASNQDTSVEEVSVDASIEDRLYSLEKQTTRMEAKLTKIEDRTLSLYEKLLGGLVVILLTLVTTPFWFRKVVKYIDNTAYPEE